MKYKITPDIFWISVLFNFFRRYYLAFPGLILLLLGIGSFPCLVIGLLMLSVNFVLSISDAAILKKHLESQDFDPRSFHKPMYYDKNDSSMHFIDVDATERDADDDGNPDE